jgi:DNA-binding MarR family transcriptional regulator
MSRNSVHAIQRFYPQIYLACHIDHGRTKSNSHHISSHDSSLLVHLDESAPVLAGELARHLGVGSSTLSAALARLESLGHLTRVASKRDRRQLEVRLTAKGAAAIGDVSVLDSRRVAGVLATLSPEDQKRAIAGLELLARAAREFQLAAPRRKRW